MSLENISFRKMNPTDSDDILDIINYYTANSTSYLSEAPLGRSSISNMLNEESIRPRYVVKYKECGNFEKIGYKNGRYFDLVWLQKFLD